MRTSEEIKRRNMKYARWRRRDEVSAGSVLLLLRLPTGIKSAGSCTGSSDVLYLFRFKQTLGGEYENQRF